MKILFFVHDLFLKFFVVFRFLGNRKWYLEVFGSRKSDDVSKHGSCALCGAVRLSHKFGLW